MLQMEFPHEGSKRSHAALPPERLTARRPALGFLQRERERTEGRAAKRKKTARRRSLKERLNCSSFLDRPHRRAARSRVPPLPLPQGACTRLCVFRAERSISQRILQANAGAMDVFLVVEPLMQRLSRRHVTFANLNLRVVNVRQNLADVAPNACPYARNQTRARRCRCAPDRIVSASKILICDARFAWGQSRHSESAPITCGLPR